MPAPLDELIQSAVGDEVVPVKYMGSASAIE
jgi:hypothetical protein